MVLLLLNRGPLSAVANPFNFWTELRSSPSPIFLAGAAQLNGIIFVIGGLYSMQTFSGQVAGSVPSNIAYSPTADSWKTVAPMPTARQSLGVITVGNVVYAIGGNDGVVGPSARVDAYDPLSDTWKTLREMPVATSGFAYGLHDSTIYVIGGTDSNGATQAVWAYDTKADLWSQKSSLPRKLPVLGDGNVVVIGDRIYVAPRDIYGSS